MIPHLHLRLEDAAKTQLAGKYLAHSLYQYPITILLNGDLGAGKTTFLQGFAEELGIEDPLVSPTYALEQRYQTKTGMPFLHLDLYRLSEKDAMIELAIFDNGHGLAADFDILKLDSLGIKLINIFSKQLKAKFEFVNQNGLRYNATFNNNKQIGLK